MKKPTSNLDSGLTDKQTKFVAAYVTDCNATRAAIPSLPTYVRHRARKELE